MAEPTSPTSQQGWSPLTWDVLTVVPSQSAPLQGSLHFLSCCYRYWKVPAIVMETSMDN